MTRVAAARGFAGASVARVIAEAGVSRATFYECFANREDCFAAAYREAVSEMERTWQLAAPAGDLSSVLLLLLEAAEADRGCARLLLIEALAGPKWIRREHHRLLGEIEGAAVAGPMSLQLPPAAVHGGISAVVTEKLLSDRGFPLVELRADLLAWLESYRRPLGSEAWQEEDWRQLGRYVLGSVPSQPLRSGESTALPRGRTALPPDASAAARRQRLMKATCAVIARRGYAAANVADIVAAARVNRSAFYSHFGSKEEALEAALTCCLQESVAAAASEFFLAEDWPQQVWRGLAAFLGYLAEHQEAAYLGMVEIYAAGENAIRHAERNRAAYSLFLADGYQQTRRPTALPEILSTAIAGGIEAIVRRQLLAGRGELMPELLPQCAYVALAPFLGAEAAIEFVTDRSRVDRPTPGKAAPLVLAPLGGADTDSQGVPA